VLVFDLLHLLAPEDEQVALSLGYALIQCDRVDDALRLLDSLRLPFREPATLALLQGKALSRLGRGIEAARAMRRFARLRQQEQPGDL
jgi:Flp pilus assembly protein TadD